MKSDTDIVVEGSRQIEQLLTKKFGAKGSGLVEQLKSVDQKDISKTLDYVIRQIAHARNGVVHRGIKLRDKSNFQKMVSAVIFDLGTSCKIEKKEKPLRQTKKDKVKPIQPKKPQNIIQYPPDFDPYVVDLKHIGIFGSDIYKK